MLTMQQQERNGTKQHGLHVYFLIETQLLSMYL